MSDHEYYEPKKPYCTVCGHDLKPHNTEKKQIRWTNKDAGVCQDCVVRLRRKFNKNFNMVNPKFRKNRDDE